jgi:hypothetical protein
MTVSNSLWDDFTQYCVTVLQYNPSKKAVLNWIHPHSFRHFYAANLRRSGVKGVYKNGLGSKQFYSIPKKLQVSNVFSFLLSTDYINRLLLKADSSVGLVQSLANSLIVEGFVVPKHKKSSHVIPLAGTLVPN